MLLAAVVIEGDRPRAYVHALADLRVTDVAEVVHLRAGFETRVLDLTEIAHLHAALEVGTGPEVRIRADGHLVFERRALERRVLDGAALPYRGVAQHRVRPDARARADRGLSLEDRPPLDDDVRRDAHAAVDLA